jgi:hypothetical protein
MKLSASDFYLAYRPSECDLRPYLHHHGVQAAKPGPFEEVIRRLGERHEKARLAGFSNATDLRGGTFEERQRRTLEAIDAAMPVIYQPVFDVIRNVPRHHRCNARRAPIVPASRLGS